MQGWQEGGAKYLGPRLVRETRNLSKMSGRWCNCQEGWGSEMCNHLLVLGPDPGSPALTGCIAHSLRKIRMVYIQASLVNVVSLPSLVGQINFFCI